MTSSLSTDSVTLRGKVVVDLTTCRLGALGRVTGIERVILDSANNLLDHSPSAVLFCHFDSWSGRFVECSFDEFRSIERSLIDVRRPVGSAPRVLAGDRSGRRRSNHFTRRMRSVGGHIRVSLRELALAGRLLAGMPRVIARLLGRARAGCMSQGWGNDTVYLNLGLVERDVDLRRLEELREKRSVHTVLMVHDLIPHTRPQLHGQPPLDVAPLVAAASVIVVNSRATRSDLEAVATSRGLALPPIRQMAMRSGLPLKAPGTRPLELDEGVEANGFVLVVATITWRKNHHLLFDVWERLIERHGADAPRLVVAGARGWASQETQLRLDRTPAFRGIVHHVSAATDIELVWLYRNCRFTVYPSLYEGWGLPVTESIAAGKVCLTSDVSSMPEAAGGLGVLLDPIDRLAWLGHVERLWFDAAQREELERAIENAEEPATDPSPEEILRLLEPSRELHREE